MGESCDAPPHCDERRADAQAVQAAASRRARHRPQVSRRGRGQAFLAALAQHETDKASGDLMPVVQERKRARNRQRPRRRDRQPAARAAAPATCDGFRPNVNGVLSWHSPARCAGLSQREDSVRASRKQQRRAPGILRACLASLVCTCATRVVALSVAQVDGTG